MTLRQTLFLLFFGCTLNLYGQSNCNNPIELSSVIVSNTSCGNSSGTIIITPVGPSSAFTFTWSPAVSSSNVGTNLTASTYSVHIVRANAPVCTLDTIIIVNNSNGPQIQADITPAYCLASNGSASLSPANLLYSWSNGASSSQVQNLAPGVYYVTATNPGNGCYTIRKIVVPRSFNFTANAVVLSEAKCGQNSGSVRIDVPQGSGQYAYSLGAGPVFSGLSAGNYSCAVTDVVSGCNTVVSFSIASVPVSGSVNLTPHDATCAGVPNGSVEIEVIPGQDFSLPYQVSLKDSGGSMHSPVNLGAGTYFLQIFDADNCPLIPDTFEIKEPPALIVSKNVNPETCDEGGSIELNLLGGNGPFIVDWLDLPGNANPEDRSNLSAGIYSVVIYDSLLCTTNLNNLQVEPLCNNSETVSMVLAVNSSDVLCWKKPVGLSGSATTFSLLNGGNTGSSAYGSWVLGSDGCLTYTAGTLAKYAADTICILRTAAQIGLKDTLCVVVSLTSKQPTRQSVFFTVQTNQSTMACGSVPANFSHFIMQQIGRPDLQGISSIYGDYTINAGNGCISFHAFNVAGFSVDEIRVAILDTLLNECHIISYIPSVIQAIDCSSVLQLPDSLTLFANDCEGLAAACLPIPYENIVQFNVLNNGVFYNSGFTGCDEKNSRTYTVSSLPAGGEPYQLNNWTINGQPFSGTFKTLAELVILMNQLDPVSNWKLHGTAAIRSDNIAGNYGNLNLVSFTGTSKTISPAFQQAFFGTNMLFGQGPHQVIIKNVLNACTDTTQISVECMDCPPVHNYSLDSLGNISWVTNGDCASDTLFCTSILLSEVANFVITDNNSSFIEYTNCGSQLAMILDTGFHVLHFVNTVTGCEYYQGVSLDCHSLMAGDTLFLHLEVGEQNTICLDTSALSGIISSITNICGNDGGFTLFDYTYDTDNWCVSITGTSPGIGNLCLELCNSQNQCVQFIIHITVGAAPNDDLIAVRDEVYTLINTDVDIGIIDNDIVNGIQGNRQGLSNIEFLTQPLNGNFTYSQLTGQLTYSPKHDFCGVDSLVYRISNALGKTSTATIFITITCDKVLVFNGISPNGDGKNDTWHILGIDQYPDNEVHIFNRWGNQVFEQKGYTNTNAWDGTWNGKALPDGTYFYILNLGPTVGKLEGYIQIWR
ncbi:MAG: gliding motility-associated C-terminal domain-containing protein [Saprospiraceae bacterium]